MENTSWKKIRNVKGLTKVSESTLIVGKLHKDRFNERLCILAYKAVRQLTVIYYWVKFNTRYTPNHVVVHQ